MASKTWLHYPRFALIGKPLEVLACCARRPCGMRVGIGLGHLFHVSRTQFSRALTRGRNLLIWRAVFARHESARQSLRLLRKSIELCCTALQTQIRIAPIIPIAQHAERAPCGKQTIARTGRPRMRENEQFPPRRSDLEIFGKFDIGGARWRGDAHRGPQRDLDKGA